jgi:hypothetical protein
MKVIGKDIGTVLDPVYGEVERRVRVEAERELRVEPFEGGSFSNVSWADDSVVVHLHNGVPTHALPHVFGVALQHVRQRLDRYPRVVQGQRDIEAGPLVRTALRELVMAPEAETRLSPLKLDTAWETEQRHQGMKDLINGAPDDWDQVGTPGNAFLALQYARFSIDHPEDLWENLRSQFAERFPAAAETGEGVLQVVQSHGWATPGACLESLVAARDELGLQQYVAIEDPRNGARY